jgi:hypothetical protein
MYTADRYQYIHTCHQDRLAFFALEILSRSYKCVKSPINSYPNIFWSATPCASPPTYLALHFFQLLFSDLPPCWPGWLASPCTCIGLWLHSHMAVSLKENIFFVTDQTLCHYPTSSIPTQFWLSHKSLKKFGLAEVWTRVSQKTHRHSIHYSTSSC